MPDHLHFIYEGRWITDTSTEAMCQGWIANVQISSTSTVSKHCEQIDIVSEFAYGKVYF